MYIFALWSRFWRYFLLDFFLGIFFLFFLPSHFLFFFILVILFSRIQWGDCYNDRTVFVIELVMAI